ncbi:hypothetical protein JZ751_025319 [Albula glossodonta]|uniref:Disks large-associated protein 5 n=1 Tax=Albula glossodonta TaxID=121402 RepID=A0A8T2NF30_9TELE|nr:hypothetical protein JZ751_025319 [Albula glossodonta]
METRFSHLYQRDSSVSMLRVKMARRRSQSQKENRDRAVNRLRRLDQLPELEASVLDESVLKPATGASDGKVPVQKQGKNDRNTAVEERKKMLARYKEAKELQKEKEKREREKKGGVFKVGLYKPQPLASLPQISAPSRAKTSAPALSTRVTRSMKQQQQAQKPVPQEAASKKVEPAAVRAQMTRVGKPQSTSTSGRGKAAPVDATQSSMTRAARRTQTASLAASRKPVPDTTANIPKTRATNKQLAVTDVGRGKPAGKAATRSQARVQKPAEVEEMDTSSADPSPEEQPSKVEEQKMEAEEQKVEPEDPPAPSSFAPKGFVFQAPSGLKTFQSVPLTPRSADAFLAPSYSSFPPALSFSPVAPQRCVEPRRPSPPPPPPKSPIGPQEPQHNVLYFRSVLVSETDRLSGLCEQWEARTEDASIPEESRDRMRTAVGQARLLMKERFSQFEGLVDDCDLGRGEKVTTCTDLQGFWDMVYFQVEDVMRKFDALKEAESRGWQEEHKPQPRQKKAVKRPPPGAAAGKAGAGAEASAAARSRLAAVKAAMKAKRAAEAERAAQVSTENSTDAVRPAEPDAQTVVFHGGFFRVESPVRVPGALRRSSRMSGAASLHGSPRPGSKFTTPARRNQCNLSAHASPLPQLQLTPRPLSSTTPVCTPRPLPQGQASPPKSNCPAESNASPSPLAQAVSLDQSENNSRQSHVPLTPQEPVASHINGHSESTGTHIQASDAASSQLQTLDYQTEANSQSELIPEAMEGLDSYSGSVAETNMAVSVPVFPGTCSQSQQAQAAETTGQNVSLSFSPCEKADPLRSQGHGLSFTLSPCQSKAEPCGPSDLSLSADRLLQCSSPAPSLSLPAPLCSDMPMACSTDSPVVSSDIYIAATPETSYVEDVPGLDFERYLRPTLRRSPSLQAAGVAMEAESPLATAAFADVQMDSPVSQQQELPVGGSLAHTAPVPAQSPVQLAGLGQAVTPQAEKVEDHGLLLFTPEPRDKVRQSVCERDLMMFTPPCSR